MRRACLPGLLALVVAPCSLADRVNIVDRGALGNELLGTELLGTVLGGRWLLTEYLGEMQPRWGKWGKAQDDALGKGAFGAVYKVEDTTSEEPHKEFALKLIHGSTDAESIAEEDEACTIQHLLIEKAKAMKVEAGSLILDCVDSCVTDREPCSENYFVSDLANGEDLDEVIKMWDNEKLARGKGDVGVAYMQFITQQLAKAVDIFAANDVPNFDAYQHRDLKPPNVKIQLDGLKPTGVTVLDYGFMALDKRDGRFRGYPYAWSPPEAFVSGTMVSPCGDYSTFDVWSLGAIYYVMRWGSTAEEDIIVHKNIAKSRGKSAEDSRYTRWLSTMKDSEDQYNKKVPGALQDDACKRISVKKLLN